MLDVDPFSTSHLKARTFDSGFAHAHDSYHAIGKASDGRIYYVLSSDQWQAAGQVFAFDPSNASIQNLGDLNEICGEAGKKAIPQGKSHVGFYEYQGHLYFSTHVGYYQLIDGMDRLPQQAPEGYALYPGGHLLSYDLASGSFQDLAILPNGEGCVSMSMDTQRGKIIGLTWPSGRCFVFDVHRQELEMLPIENGAGEAGTPGKDFRSLCRAILVDPQTGLAYISNAEGDIFEIDPQGLKSEKWEEVNLRLDYFGQYDHRYPGSMAYNWRQITWYDKGQVALGLHGNSGYLFQFDPKKRNIEILDRLCSLPSKRSGMFDQFSYGYLGLQLGPDGETLYYLTGAPIYEQGRRLEGEKRIAKGAARGLEYLHLVQYHVPSQGYRDLGPIFYPDGHWPQYVNSIAMDDAGRVYALARVPRNGKSPCDLIQITLPS